MKLIAITPDDDGSASIWWRITQPFRFLKNKYKTQIVNYIKVAETDFTNSCVILHRLIMDEPFEYVQELKRRGAHSVIYSLDDWLTNKDVYKEYLLGCGAITERMIEMAIHNVQNQIDSINACDALIVSTSELANLVSMDLESGIPIEVIPNGIPMDFWFSNLDMKAPYTGNSDKVYIGWAGGRRPESDLAMMAEAWHRVSMEYKNVWFVVAGWQPDIIDRNIDLERKIRLPWATFDKWPQHMQVDIGCCSVSDMSFNSGKSPIKYFEYTLSGAACVVSRSLYGRLIVNHLDGYVCDSVETWYDKLSRLVESREERKQLVNSATYTIENYHSLESTIIDWHVFLNGLG